MLGRGSDERFSNTGYRPASRRRVRSEDGDQQHVFDLQKGNQAHWGDSTDSGLTWANWPRLTRDAPCSSLNEDSLRPDRKTAGQCPAVP
jgi:hypothetical protein